MTARRACRCCNAAASANGRCGAAKGPDGSSWDLWQHEQHSGQRLALYDEEKKQHIRPGVVEPAAGLTRAALTFLIDAYEEIKNMPI